MPRLLALFADRRSGGRLRLRTAPRDTRARRAATGGELDWVESVRKAGRAAHLRRRAVRGAARRLASPHLDDQQHDRSLLRRRPQVVGRSPFRADALPDGRPPSARAAESRRGAPRRATRCQVRPRAATRAGPRSHLDRRHLRPGGAGGRALGARGLRDARPDRRFAPGLPEQVVWITDHAHQLVG